MEYANWQQTPTSEVFRRMVVLNKNGRWTVRDGFTGNKRQLCNVAGKSRRHFECISWFLPIK